jgi:hypothetical protein
MANVLRYSWQDAAEYGRRWTEPFGPGEGTAEITVDSVTLRAVPFTTAVDSSVFDHLKKFRVSSESFSVPKSGSLEIGVDIEAQTPGTQPGRVIHGCYGPQGSFSTLSQRCDRPYAQSALEGQQAGVVLNMQSPSGQLFDLFLSSGHAFALIERLPSTITGVGSVGLDKAYTQIIREAPIATGAHHVSIRYARGKGPSSVDYFLDSQSFAHVDSVGIPLDVQGVQFTGTYQSLGSGELLSIDAFQIGHGLFSLLDAFPFQHPDRPDLSVSVPLPERLFGQGAIGTFANFQVITRTA